MTPTKRAHAWWDRPPCEMLDKSLLKGAYVLALYQTLLAPWTSAQRLSLRRPNGHADGPLPRSMGAEGHDAGMHVELLVIPGCPGSDAASTLLRRGLDDIGLAGTPFSVRVIDSDEAARACRFAGSPAFVVDGVDLFDNGTADGALACRVYRTADGPRNVPDLGVLRQALKERAAPPARD